ncbi:amino acid adenylation domain-containing protein, partial [Agrobacterium vitis]
RRTTAERFATHFQNFLRAAISDPNQSIRRIKFLSEKEHQFIRTISGADTSRSLRQSLSAIDRIYDYARRSADRTAIVDNTGTFTYSELVKLIDRVSERLKQVGVGPGAIVGVEGARQARTIAVIIALMRMRAVVLPLDGKLPSPRLIAMLEAAQCGLVICERLGGDIDLPRMGFDDLTSQTGYAAPIEFSYLGHHDTAAIYFTSGSTGEPKAVLTSFTGIANFFNFLDAQCGLNDKDVVVQIPTLAFDASLRDSIYPLTKGAKCVLLDPDRAGDPEHLLRMMSLHRATALMSITPSFLTALTEVWHQDCSISPIPRMILASGEKLSAGLLNSVRRWHPDLIFINLYGPTECTMTSTFFPVSCDFNEAVVPVGTPIANGTVHVLDSEMQETPIGVTGEIFIGGAGLASGYLSRADLTAERFVANPFPEGGRLYRTGDRGRWRDDGQLVFIERIDQQIKIRGQRVEPAEIELALTRHPLVSQAFVILREYGDNSARLLAYIILVYGADIDSRALRTFLRETLPDYMIPSAFIPMRAFPLTLNGKLDKASLPDPFPAAPKGARPTTAMEQVVAGVWCDVLKVASVGVDDSFFELGGHSISAARMVALMRDKLGADIPLRIVFDRQTLGSFSESAIPFLPERLRSIAEQSV